MKTTFRYLAAAFAVIAAVSCAKQEINEPNQDPAQGNTYQYVLNVSQEGTKTSLGEDGLSILWSEGDQIAVMVKEDATGTLVGASTAGAQVITDGAGTSKATFNLTVPEGYTPFAAIYPYDSANTSEDANGDKEPAEGAESVVEPIASRFFIPAEQTGVKDNLPLHAFPMVGSIKDGECVMHNAGALIKFEITNTNIVSLKFEGNKGELISGRNYYNIETGELKRTTSNSETSVTLLPSEGTTVFEPGVYYFTVVPQKLTKGFTMTLTNSLGQQAVRTSTNEFNIQRNKVYTNFGSDKGWFSDVKTASAGNLGSETGTSATLYGIAPANIEDGAPYGFQTSTDGETWTDYNGELTKRFFTTASKPINIYTASLTNVIPGSLVYFRAYYTKSNGITTYGETNSFMTYANAESAIIDLYNGWETEYWPFTNIERNDPVQTAENAGINKGKGEDALYKNTVLTLQTKQNYTFDILATHGVWLGNSNGCLTMKVTLGNYIKFPVIPGKRPVRVTMCVGNLQDPENPTSTNNTLGSPSIRKVGSETNASGGNTAAKPQYQYKTITWNILNTDSSQYEMYFNTTYTKGLNCYISYLEVVYESIPEEDTQIVQNILFSDGNSQYWPFEGEDLKNAWEDLQGENLVFEFNTAIYPDIKYEVHVATIAKQNDWRVTAGRGFRFGTTGDFFRICPVPGYRITEIELTEGNTGIKYSITDDSGNIVNNYNQINVSAETTQKFEITNADITSGYRVVVHANPAIRGLKITYTKDTTTTPAE